MQDKYDEIARLKQALRDLEMKPFGMSIAKRQREIESEIAWIEREIREQDALAGGSQ